MSCLQSADQCNIPVKLWRNNTRTRSSFLDLETQTVKYVCMFVYIDIHTYIHTWTRLSRRFRLISRMMSKHSNTGCTRTSTGTAGKWRYRWRRGNRADTGGGTLSTIHGGSSVALLLMGVHADLRRNRCDHRSRSKNCSQSDLTPLLGSSCVYDDHQAGDTMVFELYQWAMAEMAPLQPVWGYGYRI